MSEPTNPPRREPPARSKVGEPSTGTSLRSRFGWGVLWNLIASVSNQGSTFAVNIVLANILGQAPFGRYAIILTTIQLTALVAGLALAYTATRYLSEFRTTDRARAGRVLAFCLKTGTASAGASAIVLVLLATPIAAVLKAPELAPLVRLAGAVSLFAVLNGVLTGAFAGLEAYARLGRIGLVSGLAYTALCVGLGWRWGLDGAVIGLVASGAFQCLLLARALIREVQRAGLTLAWRGAGSERGIIARFALPSALAGLSYAAAMWLGQTLLARQPTGYSELAGYVAALNLTGMVLFLPNVANTVGTSLLNNVGARRGPRAYQRAFVANFWATGALVVLGACAIGLTGRFLLALYGPGFGGAFVVLLLLLGGAIAESLTIALYQVLQTKHQMWAGLRSVALVRDLTFAAAAYWWVSGEGAKGLASAYLVSRALGLGAASLLVRRMMRQQAIHDQAALA